jgi:hypothetical protein
MSDTQRGRSIVRSLLLLLALALLAMAPEAGPIVADCGTDSECADKWGGNGDPEPVPTLTEVRL